MAKSLIAKKYLASLGAIEQASCLLEFHLISSISLFADQEYDETMCLVAGDGTDVLLKKLARLFYLYVKDKSLIDQCESLKEAITNVNDDRNLYAHSYLILEDKNKIIRVKLNKRFNKSLHFERIPVSLDSLKVLAAEIRDVTEKLIEFSVNAMDIRNEYKKRIAKETGRI